MLRSTSRSSAVLLLIVLTTGLASAAAPPAGDFFAGPERALAAAEVDRLRDIQVRHESRLLDRPGVHGMGIGVDPVSRELVFLIAVDKNGLAPRLPGDIEGVRVVVDRSDPPMPLHGGSSCIPCHADQQALPVPMGNSTGNPSLCFACTLGFKACHRSTGQLVYVTNAHCSPDSNGCVGGAPIGSDTLHRSRLDAFCGITTDIGDVGGYATPVCNGTDNRVDGARIFSADNLTSRTIRDIGTASMLSGTVLPGDVAQKSGRTTGFTVGIVNSVNYTTNVGPYDCCGTARFVNQIRVNADVLPFIQPGDSGSALLNFQSPPRIVGLLFAGPEDGSYGVANRIADVLSQLNLTLDTTCPPTACFTMNPTFGPAPLTVTFDASCSSDPGGSIVNYSWDFGDGRTGSGQTVTITYFDPDVYSIQLTVTDNQGGTDTEFDALLVTGDDGCIFCP